MVKHSVKYTGIKHMYRTEHIDLQYKKIPINLGLINTSVYRCKNVVSKYLTY